jgi:hypothetical protein
MKKEYVPFMLIGVIIILILLLSKGCNKIKELQTSNSLLEHLDDSAKFYRNKFGELVARNVVLENNSTKEFLKIKSSDSLINQLQARVKEYQKQLKSGGSVTNINTSTNIHKGIATQIMDREDDIFYWRNRFEPFDLNKKKDTTKNDVYFSNYKDKWIDYQISAFKDTIYLDVEITDKYSVVVGSERDKWYKKKKTFVDVISESPYTQIKSLKAYKVSDERKPTRLSLGIQIGYGLTPIPKPYIGIGLQYNVLNIF